MSSDGLFRQLSNHVVPCSFLDFQRQLLSETIYIVNILKMFLKVIKGDMDKLCGTKFEYGDCSIFSNQEVVEIGKS